MPDKVKLKFLKPVGQWSYGEEAEVSKEEAEHLLKPRHKHVGQEIKQYHVAIPAEQFERLSRSGSMGETLAEAKARGARTVVDSSEKKSAEDLELKSETSKKDSVKSSKK